MSILIFDSEQFPTLKGKIAILVYTETFDREKFYKVRYVLGSHNVEFFYPNRFKIWK